MGDIDGNGVDDLAVHVHAERAVVRVCLDDGTVEGGLGMAETLELVDVDRDGQVVVYYGATTGHAEGGHLAVWHDGQLRQITRHDGSPLLLERGGAGTFDDDAGTWSEYHGWGCDDLDDDGARELVTAHTVESGDGYQTAFTGYTLNGATAVEKLQTTRRESAPIDQAQERVPSCEPDGHDV